MTHYEFLEIILTVLAFYVCIFLLLSAVLESREYELERNKKFIRFQNKILNIFYKYKDTHNIYLCFNEEKFNAKEYSFQKRSEKNKNIFIRFSFINDYLNYFKLSPPKTNDDVEKCLKLILYKHKKLRKRFQFQNNDECNIYFFNKVFFYYNGISQHIRFWEFSDSITHPSIYHIYIDQWDEQKWYYKNKLHRNDGPAVINAYTHEWYWYGDDAKSKEQWLDPQWRKKSEILTFL